MVVTKKLTIFKVEQKASATGKSYWIAETSEGRFSIWDLGLYEMIKSKGVGNLCEIGLTASTKVDKNGNPYLNLVSLISVIGPGQVQEKKVEISESARLRRRTDCMIASKDLVIAKIVPLENLLDKAQTLFDWVEETSEEQNHTQLNKLTSPDKAFS